MDKYRNALDHYRALEKSLEQEPVNKELLEYTRTAIEAIEMRIPKTPDIEGDSVDDNGDLLYDTWYCPYCYEKYEIDYHNYKCCPECGQAIDRRELK